MNRHFITCSLQSVKVTVILRPQNPLWTPCPDQNTIRNGFSDEFRGANRRLPPTAGQCALALTDEA
jgi:hypothetical protein